MEGIGSKKLDRRSTRDIAADRLVLRMAFAATFAFAIAEMYDWNFSFLAPMLAVQILSAMPSSPGFRQGIAIPIVIFAANSVALAMSSLFSITPAMLLALTGLVICLSFYALRRGAPGVVILLIQIAFCSIPVMSTISTDIAQEFATSLLWGSIAAVITVWIAHLLFPPPSETLESTTIAQKPSGLEPAYAARVAISDTLVLIPLLVAFIIGGDINNIVILIIALSLLRAIEPERMSRVAAGILLGNFLGGLLAVSVNQIVVLADSFAFFVLIVLAMSLWLGSRIAHGGTRAPVYAIAFGTFLLILGLGITPLPGGSEMAFSVRILKIMIASGFVIGALSLVERLRRDQALVQAR
jgi:Protein of unknown function (DUF2955)